MWTAANVSLRYMMRLPPHPQGVKGRLGELVRDRRLVSANSAATGSKGQFRTMLRENGIFSMFDVDDVRFETNGG